MIPLTKLTGVVLRNTLRSRRHFVLSVFGIVVGIGAFVAFVAFTKQVRNVLVGKVFPIERVEVRAPRAAFSGQQRKIDDATVDVIRDYPRVKTAVPRMMLAFPAKGYGWFDSQRLEFEAGGFCDGVDESFIDKAHSELFRDWESEEHRAAQKPCKFVTNDKGERVGTCEKADRYYCDKKDNKCHHRVPVLISRALLELYNGQFAKSHNLPPIPTFAEFLAQRGLGKMRFYISLGDTMVTGSNSQIDASRFRHVEALMVGISDKAMQIGMTIPIQYVRRWNAEFAGEEAATSYSSVVVILKQEGDVAPFAEWLRDKLDLRLKDNLGESFATAIFVVQLLFIAIALIIVTISAINIAHNLFMQISERRREIGVLRAIGATRSDIRRIVLGEAAAIGLAGGCLGILLARTVGWIGDRVLHAALPRYPFEPSTYFDFHWTILVTGLGGAVFFCVLGGFLPARRAANMAPAQALAQQ